MTVKLIVKKLSKLFNDPKGEGLKRLQRGESKEHIFRETGVVVGVNDVSFEVQEGEIFVIMGLSGSGKSTLVRMLNGLIPPTSGEIWIDKDDIASCGKARLREVRRRKITMVFQHFALFPHKTVGENVAYGLKVKGAGKEERRATAINALAKVGLQDHADSLPSQLSGGMQQRVGLARGLATDPEILLMDEPFGALDPLIRREMQDELVALQKELKKTIIFITHDLNEALLLGDRIAIMKDGSFVQVGTAQDIVSEPADDYVRAFVADIDRSRVYTASDILQEASQVPYTGTAADVLKVMDENEIDTLHVVQKGKAIGFVTRYDALSVDPKTPVRKLMQAEPPSVTEDVYLNELFSAAQSGVPVAVTDEKGRLLGVIAPESIFEHLIPDEEPAEDDTDDTGSPDGDEPEKTPEPAVLADAGETEKEEGRA